MGTTAVVEQVRNLHLLSWKNSFGHGVLSWSLACLLIACTETPPAEQIVALVDEEPITENEVEEFAALLLRGLRSRKSGDAARLDYLQTLIDEKLLVLEARAQGLDTSRTFKAGLEKAFRKKVVDDYQQRHLFPRIIIAEEEVQDRFIKDGFDRERALSRLVVKTAEEAAQLREQLEQGADFAALARAHSLEEGRASKGGYVGFIIRPWAARNHIPPQVFEDLLPGEISQPLPVQSVYQLIRFAEDRETDFNLYRNQVYNAIWKEEMRLHRRALAEELAYEFALQLHSNGLEILKNKQTGMRIFPKLSTQEAATPLYLYKQGEITVGDYIGVFREFGVKPGLGDSLEVVQAAWQFAIPDRMFWEDARQSGYDGTAPVLRWKEREEIDLLLKALRQKAVVDQVVISREETEQFYRDHPRLFAESTEIWIQEILVDDLDRATEVRQRLDAGADMAALVHLSQRPGAAETDGKLHLHGYAEGIFGNLVSRALEAEPGQLVGPAETKGGYTVFRVLEKSGGQPLPFEQVEQRVKATVRYRKEGLLFNVLVSAVREKYADQVRIFEAVLSKVELPAEPTSTSGEVTDAQE